MNIKDLFVTNKRNTIIALSILAIGGVGAYALDTMVSSVEPEKPVTNEKFDRAFKEHFSGDSSSKSTKSIKKREGIPSPLFYSPLSGEEGIALHDNPDLLFSNKEEAIKQAREKALGKIEADKQREVEEWDRRVKEETEKMQRYEEEEQRQYQERKRKEKERYDKHWAEVEAKKAAEKQTVAKTEEPEETPSIPAVPSSLVSNINQVSTQSNNDQCEPCSPGCEEGYICDDEEDVNGYDNTWVWDAEPSRIAEKFNIPVTKTEGVIPFWKELPPDEPVNKVIKTSNGKYSLMVKGDSKVWTHQPGKGSPYDFTCHRQQATLIADNKQVEFSPICAFYYGPLNP